MRFKPLHVATCWFRKQHVRSRMHTNLQQHLKPLVLFYIVAFRHFQSIFDLWYSILILLAKCTRLMHLTLKCTASDPAWNTSRILMSWATYTAYHWFCLFGNKGEYIAHVNAVGVSLYEAADNPTFVCQVFQQPFFFLSLCVYSNPFMICCFHPV